MDFNKLNNYFSKQVIEENKQALLEKAKELGYITLFKQKLSKTTIRRLQRLQAMSCRGDLVKDLLIKDYGFSAEDVDHLHKFLRDYKKK
jgi:hypothetical protein